VKRLAQPPIQSPSEAIRRDLAREFAELRQLISQTPNHYRHRDNTDEGDDSV
jgi:hypothetical protein